MITDWIMFLECHSYHDPHGTIKSLDTEYVSLSFQTFLPHGFFVSDLLLIAKSITSAHSCPQQKWTLSLNQAVLTLT